MRLLVASLVLCSGLAAAQEPMRSEAVRVKDGEKTFVGTLTWNGSTKHPRPALLMIPNWMGPTAESAEKARKIAAMGYVVLMWDVYGEDVRPTNPKEAGQAAGALRSGDRKELRRRVQLGLETLLANQAKAPVDPKRAAAIGFCFGGGAVLELARAGAKVGAVVSFHGNLDTPRPADAQRIRCKVLVLHGAKDPLVPPEQLEGFKKEMAAAKVDYELVAYPDAVHSFTNPHAKRKGRAEYHAESAKKSFAKMREVLGEVFSAKKD